MSTWSGWCYTAFVVDVFAQRIVGWACASTMATQLVTDAVSMATWSRAHHDRPTSTRLIHPRGCALRLHRILTFSHFPGLAKVGR